MKINMKLLYIIPNKEKHTHFVYLEEFVHALREKRADVVLLVENKWGQVPFLKILFIFVNLIYYRLRGYNKVYVHYSFLSGILASIIFRLSFGKVFYWNCGLPWQYKRSGFREFFEKLNYKLINYLITGSSSLVEGYSNYYKIKKEKILIVPNWIDMAEVCEFVSKSSKEKVRSELGLPQDKRIVLFVHKLVPRKGSRYLPKIVSGLPDNAELVVLGGGPEAEKERIVQEITESGNIDKVRFMGFVSHDEVKKYLAISDLFVMPSEEEGFPHSLLEAMAYGVPFVAFDVGGVRGMVPEHLQNFIVPFSDIEKFITQINQILNTQVHLQKDERLVNWLKQFDKEMVVDTFLSIVK
jgi:glycosyltransferase involved in cell wall biosynthesis